jgi:hypothetical protein
MHDAGKIVVGLGAFAGVVAFPVWLGLARGTTSSQVKLELGTSEKACVLPVAEMRASHMQLLDEWRTRVVRDGQRDFKSPSGRVFPMSLTKTCLGCHQRKTEFCDRCHDAAGVKPVCWDCHVDAAGRK